MDAPDMLTIKNNIPITVQRITLDDLNHYPGRIVGYIHMRYLVIGGLGGVMLQVGELILIRMVSEGEAVAYQVAVKKIHNDPLLFMTTFPERVETVSLRKHERIKAFFPAEVRQTSETAFKNFDAMVVDISEGGCSFSCRTALKEGETAVLAFSLPGKPTIARLEGEIVGVSTRNAVFVHRVKFKDVEDNEAGRSAIRQWVSDVSAFALD